MRVTGENYEVIYDSSISTIICKGSMDLRGKDGYMQVAELFEKVIEKNPANITLDIRNLKYLNSSGITTIGAGLVIKARKKGVSRFVIHSTKNHAWQARSMKGIVKLMPGMELKFD